MQADSPSTKTHYVVLDRDGTMIEDKHYLTSPSGVKFLPKALEGLARLKLMGFGLVILTNQSAIGRGYMNTEDLASVHQRLEELLGERGIAIDAIYHCPHIPSDGCDCRKPNPGMINQASVDLGLEPTKCFVIGDRLSDVQLGRSVGATTFLIVSAQDQGLQDKYTPPADYFIKDLNEAASIIQNIIGSI